MYKIIARTPSDDGTLFSSLPSHNSSTKEFFRVACQFSKAWPRFLESLLQPSETVLEILATLITLARELTKSSSCPLVQEAKKDLITLFKPVYSLSRVLFSSSLARTNQSAEDISVSTLLTAVLINLSGLQMTTHALAELWGFDRDHVDLESVPCTEKTIKMDHVFRKFRQTLEDSIASESWQATKWRSMVRQLERIQNMLNKVPDPSSSLEKINALQQMILAKLCSTGSKAQMDLIEGTVIALLPHKKEDPHHERLCLFADARSMTQAQLMAGLVALGIPLYRNLFVDATNIHNIRHLVLQIAIAKNPGDLESISRLRESYRAPQADIISEANPVDLCAHFDDPLSLATHICCFADDQQKDPGSVLKTFERHGCLESRGLSMARLCPEVLSNFAEWVIQEMPVSSLSIWETQFSQVGISLLAVAMRMAHEAAFEQLATKDFLKIPPVGCDGRDWVHLALWGGSKLILDRSWKTVISDPCNCQVLYAQSTHHLLDHAATAQTGVAVCCVLDNLHRWDVSVSEKQAWLTRAAPDGFTPLQRAAFCGNSRGLRRIIEAYTELGIPSEQRGGTGVFQYTAHGQSLLLLAVQSNCPETLAQTVTALGEDFLPWTVSPANGQSPAQSALHQRNMPAMRLYLNTMTSVEDKLRYLAPILGEPELPIHVLLPELSTLTTLKDVQLSVVAMRRILLHTSQLESLELFSWRNLDILDWTGICFTKLRKLSIHQSGISDARLKAFLKAMPNICEVSLINCTGLDNPIDLSGIDLPHLERVSLNGSKLSARMLQSFLERTPALVSLSLISCRYSSGEDTVLSGIPLMKLTELGVEESGISSHHLRDLLSRAQNIKKISVRGNALLAKSVSKILEAEPEKVLTLDDIHNIFRHRRTVALRTRNLPGIQKYLKTLSSLEAKLAYLSPILGDRDLPLGDLLPELETLTTFTCRDLNGRSIRTILKHSPRLETLDLSHNRTLDGLDLTGIILPALTTFHAKSSDITGNILDSLLQAMPHIVNLQLEDCFKIAEGVELSKMTLPNLRKVSLKGSNIEPHSLQNLLKRMPNIVSLDISHCCYSRVFDRDMFVGPLNALEELVMYGFSPYGLAEKITKLAPSLKRWEI